MNDAETTQLLSDGEEVENLIASRGWGFIHGKLLERVADLQNIGNLDLTKPDTFNIQIAARLMAAEYIKDWLTKDVFGFVEQQKANREALTDKPDKGFIGR